jgi:hypothetical protein
MCSVHWIKHGSKFRHKKFVRELSLWLLTSSRWPLSDNAFMLDVHAGSKNNPVLIGEVNHSLYTLQNCLLAYEQECFCMYPLVLFTP